MYKLKEPSRKDFEPFFNDAKNTILGRIKDWLDGKVVDVKVSCGSKKLNLTAKINPGGLTEEYLKLYSNEDNLKELMLGRMSDFVQLVRDLKDKAVKTGYPQDYIFDSLTLKDYERLENGGKKLKLKLTATFDHFNTIFHDVFVDHGYNGEKSKKEPVFKKDEFVKLLNLRICPYCGRAFIYSVQREGDNTVVKPQLDHFLPKGKYPFLALSFMNLIPSCQTCNMKDCKGENNPIEDFHFPIKYRIQYPYSFDAKKLTFEYVLNGSHYSRDDNFDIKVNYHGDKDLEKGCNEYLKIEELYKHHNVELAGMYRQMMVLASKATFYYEKFKIDKHFLRPNPMIVLGFNLNEANSGKYMLYKFKNDIYLQMMGGEVRKLF